MTAYIYGDPFTPVELRDTESGLRPSFGELLKVIDLSDPAWPATASVLREMVAAGVEIDQRAVRIAAQLGAQRFAALYNAKPAGREDLKFFVPSGSIVYYIRRGPVIKIGTTAEAASRFTDLMPDEILAFEPGGYAEENLRHAQFAHLRCRGEHFRPEPELLEHVRLTRELHGDPDPDWPTVAGLARSPDIREVMPPLKSDEMITAEEALERGATPRFLRTSIAAGRVTPAGYTDDGEALYYTEHLAAIYLRKGRY
jgi:hypothetical protein